MALRSKELFCYFMPRVNISKYLWPHLTEEYGWQPTAFIIKVQTCWFLLVCTGQRDWSWNWNTEKWRLSRVIILTVMKMVGIALDHRNTNTQTFKFVPLFAQASTLLPFKLSLASTRIIFIILCLSLNNSNISCNSLIDVCKITAHQDSHEGSGPLTAKAT